MRYPRFLFASSVIILCLLLDFVVGRTQLPAEYAVNSSAPTSSQSQTSAIPLAISSDPPPVITPPNFGALDKPSGIFPPPMSAAFSDFPEPQFNSTGMMLLSFNDASQFCAKKNKRLPTILEAARWGKHHGASMATPQDAKERHRANPTSAVYIERTNKTSTVDFYFEKSRFVYPAQRPITNAAIWTSDKRALGGNQNASHYAFSMYEAYFSPVPETSALAVVCLDNK